MSSTGNVATSPSPGVPSLSPKILAQVQKLQGGLTGNNGQFLIKGYVYAFENGTFVKKFDGKEITAQKGVVDVCVMNESGHDIIIQPLVSSTDHLRLNDVKDFIGIEAGKKTTVYFEKKTDEFVPNLTVYFSAIIVPSLKDYPTIESKRAVFASLTQEVKENLKKAAFPIRVVVYRIPGTEKLIAVASVKGERAKGCVLFEEMDDGKIKVSGEISGLAKGTHGLHVREFGDIRGNWTKVGPHLNPFKNMHAGPKDTIRHVGDLGNIVAATNGVAKFEFIDEIIKLSGQNTIIGRAITVGEKEDDFGHGSGTSKEDGNSGTITAGGVIGWAFR